MKRHITHSGKARILVVGLQRGVKGMMSQLQMINNSQRGRTALSLVTVMHTAITLSDTQAQLQATRSTYASFPQPSFTITHTRKLISITDGGMISGG